MTATRSLLSAAQQQQFADDGYCVAAGLFNEGDLREIGEFFEEYKLTGGTAFDGGTRYEEIDRAARQVRALHPHRFSERAKAWFLNANVASALEALLGQPALGAQTMYYFNLDQSRRLPPNGRAWRTGAIRARRPTPREPFKVTICSHRPDLFHL